MPITTGLNANVFRAVSGSLFSSPVNWSRGVVPTGSDVALIADNCTIDISRVLGSLIVQPGFTASINTGLTLQVNDVINVLGHLSCSGNPTINLLSRKNNINSLSAGLSTFNYSRTSNQSVASALYYSLGVYGIGNKIAIGNISCSGSLTLSGGPTFELGTYNLNISGSANVGTFRDDTATISKSQPGSIIFNGPLITNRTSFPTIMAGNPTIQFINGISDVQNNTTGYPNRQMDLGRNVISFVSNSQSVIGVDLYARDILIGPGITASFGSSNSNTVVTIYNNINGTNSGSNLVNLGTIYLNTPNTNIMTTGSFDFSTNNNTISYNFVGPQIVNYSFYRNLDIRSNSTVIATKTASSSISISGSLNITSAGILELGSNNLVVSGTTFLGPVRDDLGTLSKSGPGNIIFVGPVVTNRSQNPLALSGNPNLEFRGGISNIQGGSVGFTSRTLLFGNGTASFTTNNQSLARCVISASNILIHPNITLTNTDSNGYLYMDGVLNGSSSNSVFINSGSLFLTTPRALTNFMPTGSWNFSFPGNIVGFSGDYSATSSVNLNNFHGLSISGTGIKTLGTSSYVSNSLSIDGNGYLNMSSSNLTINGTLTTGLSSATMTLGTGNLYVSGASTVWQFSKIITSASNNVIFNGLLDFRDYGVQSLLDFTAGSPNVEVRNGIYTNQGNDPGPMRSGFGTWSFTTNNQALTGQFIGSLTFTGSVLISGSITISNRIRTNIYQPINGTNSNSKFENFTNSILGVYTTSSLMTTGIIDVKTYPNTVFYAMDNNTNYNIPYQSYRSLQIGGVGVKSINQNTDITGSLYVSSPAAGYTTFELSSYNLFVSGTTSIINARLSKSGSGNIIFNDLVTFWDYGTPYIVDFSLGNPNVEIRNGLYATNQGSTLGSINSGTGSWVFSTNNQTLTGASTNLGITIKAPITISGPITFTVNLSPIFSGSINGDNANSKLLMAANSTINYVNSSTPMSIGILDVTSSLGTTFIYSSGSQNIRGGTYRNLTMLNGTKTLQGNVSVLGTLNTGSGATLATINLNGFTLTNP